MEDEARLRNDGVPAQARSAGVGTSVAVFGTSLIIFGAINSYFSRSTPTPDVFCGFALLYFGASARKGKRRAMKWCVWLSALCFVAGLLATALLLSHLLAAKHAEPPPARLYFFLGEVIVIYSWSATNIVWLFKVLKLTRPRGQGPAVEQSIQD